MASFHNILIGIISFHLFVQDVVAVTQTDNIAVLIREPVASAGRLTAITVYSPGNSTNISLYRASYGKEQERLVFNPIDTKLPRGYSVENGQDGVTTFSLNSSANFGPIKSAIYKIEVDLPGEVEPLPLRVVIANQSAEVVPTDFPSHVLSVGESITLGANTAATTGDLRWRIDGTLSPIHARTRDFRVSNLTSGVHTIECFVVKNYKLQQHGMINLLIRACGPDRWGGNCSLTCPICRNGGICSDDTGACLCPPGFSGADCGIANGRNVFGQNGQYKCNEAGDNDDDGCRGVYICYASPYGCSCAAGYTGFACVQECKEGQYGANCNQQCSCSGDERCAKDTGVCTEVDTVTIEEFRNVRVNPGVTTFVHCDVSGMLSALRLSSVVLRVNDGQEGIEAGSMDSRGNNTLYTWHQSFQPGDNMSCIVRGFDELTTNVSLFTLPSYGGTKILEFTDISFTGMSVSWPGWAATDYEGDGPVIGYKLLYRANDTDYTTVDVRLATSYYLDSLMIGTRYRFGLVVVRGGENGDGPPSEEQTKRTCKVLPVGLTPTGSTARTASFSVQLPEQPACGEQYPAVVLQKQLPSGNWRDYETLQTSSPTSVDNLLPCSTHKFRLAVKSLGSIRYRTSEVQMHTAPEAHGAVMELEVTPRERGGMAVSWSPPDQSNTGCDVDQYNVIYALRKHKSCPDSAQSVPLERTTNDVRLDLTGLEDYAIYNVSVMAVITRNTPENLLGSPITVTGSTVAARVQDSTEVTSHQRHTLTGLEHYAIYDVSVVATIAGTNLLGPPMSTTGTTVADFPENEPSVQYDPNQSTARRLMFNWQTPRCEDLNGPFKRYVWESNKTREMQEQYIYSNATTTKLLPGLMPCSTYTFSLRVENSVGVGPPAIRTATTSAVEPAAVRGVTVIPRGQGSLEVTWMPPDTGCGVDKYKVVYALQKHVACPDIAHGEQSTEVTSQKSTILTRLEDYAIYDVSVVSVVTRRGSPNLLGPPVNATGTTAADVPANAPVVQFQQHQSSTRRLRFTWETLRCEDLNGQFRRYVIILVGAQSGEMQTNYITTETTKLTDLSALVPCTTYQFSLAVENSIGIGPNTIENATTSAEKPGRWFNLRTTSMTSRSFSVTWQTPHGHPCPVTEQNLHFQRLQLEDCVGQNVIKNVTFGESRRMYWFRELQPGSEYQVQLRASNSKGYGPYATLNASTSEEMPSAAPENVIMRNSTSRSLQFSWEEPACDSRHGIIIEYSYILKAGNVTVAEARRSSNIVELGELIPYTNYTFNVRAYTQRGPGPYSDTFDATTAEDVPPRLYTPKAVFTNASTIRIRWGAPDPPNGVILGYTIWYQPHKVGLPKWYINVSATEDFRRIISLHDLQANTAYFIKVRARTRIGPGRWSARLVKRTGEDLPGMPSDVTITARTETTLAIEWAIPQNTNGNITQYELAYHVSSRPYDPGFSGRGEITTVIVYSTEGDERYFRAISDLDPSTGYEIELSAYTSMGKGGSSLVSAITKLYTGLRPVNNMSSYPVKRSENGVTIVIPALKQKYATSYYIKVRVDGRARRSVGDIQSFESNPNEYITAVLDKAGEDREFTVGDGKTYNGYYNAPLEKDLSYQLDVGVASQNGEEAEVMWSEDSVEITGYRGGGISFLWVLLFLLIFCLILVAAIFIYRRKKRQEKEEQEAYERSLSVRENRPKPEIVVLKNGSTEEVEMTGKSSKKPPVAEKPKGLGRSIKISELVAYVKNKKSSENDNFLMEYERIPDAVLHSWTVAAKPENKKKNRYGNIIPYDNSRIVLEKINDDPHSDYTNASYIDGYKYPTKYIASHGPNTASVKDFWRMVWQEDVGKIVMLTNLVEMGKKKCEKYWPDEALKYGSIIVTKEDETHYPAYDVKTFTVQSVTSEETKTVLHYHFTAWPDMKVPDFAGPILELLQQVRADSSTQTGPMIVHCSAGVGRTGTFMTLDSMLDMAEAEGKVNVFDYVCQMRENRVKMVQIPEQYQFIFDALVEYFVIGNTSLQVATYRTEYTRLRETNIDSGKSHMEEEFQMLKLVSVDPPDSTFQGGKDHENRKKNRFASRLPLDKFRPYLMTEVEDCNNYINASFLSGFKKRDMFLGTQMPLQNTVLDFWRMIWDYNSYIIVMLNEMDSVSTVEYWQETGTLTCGPFSIELLLCEDHGDIRYRKLGLTHESQMMQGARTIMHLQCLNWPNSDATPRSNGTLLQAIGMLDQWDAEKEAGPITVHCIDGIGRTGVFCTVLSALDQIEAQGKVDVFQLVNKLRSSRPNMVQSLEQYQCIFNTVLAHLEDDIYENVCK